ncbi:hypothetical protein [Herbaspirillum sp. alder98]|uniref:hypothetical protein n=1 Tax=Herbaspirillum sp. alder98 TaxID=2913096 RepID=UPI0039BCB7C0
MVPRFSSTTVVLAKVRTQLLRTDVVVMGIVLIGIIAYLFDLAMRRLSQALTPWRSAS